MTGTLAERSVGEIVPIVARSRRVSSGSTNGQLVVATFAFTIKNGAGTTVVSSAAPSAVLQDGEALYRFDTTGVSPGNYRIEVTGTDVDGNIYGPLVVVLRLVA